MQKAYSAPKVVHSTKRGKNKGDVTASASQQRNSFVAMALDMSWQLAVVVLVPILAGVRLDKTLSTGYMCTFVGLGVALVGSGVVMWRAMQAANRLPVPKLSAAQKRAIRKSYDEDDQ